MAGAEQTKRILKTTVAVSAAGAITLARTTA